MGKAQPAQRAPLEHSCLNTQLFEHSCFPCFFSFSCEHVGFNMGVLITDTTTTSNKLERALAASQQVEQRPETAQLAAGITHVHPNPVCSIRKAPHLSPGHRQKAAFRGVRCSKQVRKHFPCNVWGKRSFSQRHTG